MANISIKVTVNKRDKNRKGPMQQKRFSVFGTRCWNITSNYLTHQVSQSDDRIASEKSCWGESCRLMAIWNQNLDTWLFSFLSSLWFRRQHGGWETMSLKRSYPVAGGLEYGDGLLPPKVAATSQPWQDYSQVSARMSCSTAATAQLQHIIYRAVTTGHWLQHNNNCTLNTAQLQHANW